MKRFLLTYMTFVLSACAFVPDPSMRPTSESGPPPKMPEVIETSPSEVETPDTKPAAKVSGETPISLSKLELKVVGETQPDQYSVLVRWNYSESRHYKLVRQAQHKTELIVLGVHDQGMGEYRDQTVDAGGRYVYALQAQDVAARTELLQKIAIPKDFVIQGEMSAGAIPTGTTRLFLAKNAVLRSVAPLTATRIEVQEIVAAEGSRIEPVSGHDVVPNGSPAPFSVKALSARGFLSVSTRGFIGERGRDGGSGATGAAGPPGMPSFIAEEQAGHDCGNMRRVGGFCRAVKVCQSEPTNGGGGNVGGPGGNGGIGATGSDSVRVRIEIKDAKHLVVRYDSEGGAGGAGGSGGAGGAGGAGGSPGTHTPPCARRASAGPRGPQGPRGQDGARGAPGKALDPCLILGDTTLGLCRD